MPARLRGGPWSISLEEERGPPGVRGVNSVTQPVLPQAGCGWGAAEPFVPRSCPFALEGLLAAQPTDEVPWGSWLERGWGGAALASWSRRLVTRVNSQPQGDGGPPAEDPVFADRLSSSVVRGHWRHLAGTCCR